VSADALPRQLAMKHVHDGLTVAGVEFVLQHALLALERSESLSLTMLEIGSYKGGTSLALLDLADLCTPRPFLFTVDPYGGKPYNGGNVLLYGGLYSNPVYVAHKLNTARFPNHAHFYMTGEQFLRRVVGATYWYECQERKIDDFVFAFVDGDHDRTTVLTELDRLLPHMADGGRIVIDNVDMDPDLVNVLGMRKDCLINSDMPPGARQAMIRT
jgi:hypothetical protein